MARINWAADTDTVWDDLKFPATAINPPGAVSDPDVQTTSGLLLFDAAGTELIYALAQMPHAWAEGSIISPHIHWDKTTSAAGNVLWRLRYKHSPIGGIIDANWSDYIDAVTPVPGTPDTNAAGKHLISSFGEMDMDGYTLSHCILFEVSRHGGEASDTYAADARLIEFDVHFQIDALGSELLFTKTV